MKSTLLAIGLAGSALAGAQSPFQDARGESSLILPNGGYAQLAFDNTSARFGYLYDLSRRNYVGFEVFGKVSGNTAQLFSNNQLVNDTRFKLTYGIRMKSPYRDAEQNKAAFLEKERKEILDLLEKAQEAGNIGAQADLKKRLKENIKATEDLGKESPYETLSVQVAGRAASYKLFNPAADFGSQFRDRRFEGWGVDLAYNGLRPGVRYGVSLGVNRDNNVDSDLTQVNVTERQTFAEGGAIRTVENKIAAYVGQYNTSVRVPLNSDIVWWPGALNHQVALNVYTRMDLNDCRSFRPGVGIFLCKPGAPTSVVGGFTVSFQNGKPQAALIAGYSF